MTAREIADRILLEDGRDLTPLRVQKVQALCQRAKVPIADVIALLPADYQQALR